MEENTQPKGTVGTEALATTTRAQHAGGGGAKAVAHRFSAKMKLSAVQRLLRGESLEAVSRDLNLVAHRLSEWRDRVLTAAESALKERDRDERDDEIDRLKAKVGEITRRPGSTGKAIARSGHGCG
jgi:transposase-like protein